MSMTKIFLENYRKWRDAENTVSLSLDVFTQRLGEGRTLIVSGARTYTTDVVTST